MLHQQTGRLSIAGLCLLFVFMFAISGCGKKGPLFMPPADKAPTQK